MSNVAAPNTASPIVQIIVRTGNREIAWTVCPLSQVSQELRWAHRQGYAFVRLDRA